LCTFLKSGWLQTSKLTPANKRKALCEEEHALLIDATKERAAAFGAAFTSAFANAYEDGSCGTSDKFIRLVKEFSEDGEFVEELKDVDISLTAVPASVVGCHTDLRDHETLWCVRGVQRRPSRNAGGEVVQKFMGTNHTRMYRDKVCIRMVRHIDSAENTDSNSPMYGVIRPNRGALLVQIVRNNVTSTHSIREGSTGEKVVTNGMASVTVTDAKDLAKKLFKLVPNVTNPVPGGAQVSKKVARFAA
jgi:hypothetical protein